MRPMGAGLELYEKHKDGSEFPVDIMISPVETAEGLLVLGVIRMMAIPCINFLRLPTAISIR